MNKKLKIFMDIGIAIAKTQVPAIATVELAVKNLKAGKDKKENVLEIVKNSPVIAELISGKEIIDEDLFNEGLSEINDGYVKIMDSIKKDD